MAVGLGLLRGDFIDRWLIRQLFPCCKVGAHNARDLGAFSGMANEAFAWVKVDQLLRDADWHLTDGRSVRYEYPLDDGGKADYALFDRQGRALAVLEAKSTSINLSAGEAQGRGQHFCPFIQRQTFSAINSAIVSSSVPRGFLCFRPPISSACRSIVTCP